MATKRDRNIPPGILDPNRRTIVNQITGERIELAKYGYETGGKTTEAFLWCKPGGGPPLHYHKTYAERFEAVDGDLIVKLGDNPPRTLKPGETADVPIGVKHTFTCEGEEEVKFKGFVMPSHAGFERSLYVLFGLAGDGLLNEQGMPKSLVHTALLAGMSDISFPGASGVVMNLLLSVLGVYGRWSGEEERLLQKYWD